MVTLPETETLQDVVFQNLVALPATRRYLVAYSGGVDSTVLLHIMVQLGARLDAVVEAVHIDHCLQPQSREWAEFCREVCAELGVGLHVESLDSKPARGESLEAWAREQRYSLMGRYLKVGDMLLTAHHQRDQAEGVLVQLLRGGGPHGVAGMPEHSLIGNGVLARPMLGIESSSVNGYAAYLGLRWIEDPSNTDQRYVRNFLRNQILPLLRRRWPSVDGTLSRASGWQAQAAQLLNELGEIDLEAVRQGSELNIELMQDLSAERQFNLLRHWIRCAELELPSERRLNEIAHSLLGGVSRSGLVAWPGAEVRRYRDRLYLLKPRPEHRSSSSQAWQISVPLDLICGVLRAEESSGVGLSVRACADAPISVRFRGGGERGRLPGHAHHNTLKTLCQSAGIPPWERQRLPLVYVGEDLAAVADLWTFEPYAAKGDEPAWGLIWEPNYRIGGVDLD